LLAFQAETVRAFGEYLGAVNVNLGCGRNLEPGFLNVDRAAGPGVDALCDLERELLPFASDSVDCVLASHVLEHITHLVPLMREIHRVLKPGGHVIAVTPYASSNDAWEDPTHVRAFSEGSWMYFDARLYARDGHHGAYASAVDFTFDVVKIHLVPFSDLTEEFKKVGLDDRHQALTFGRRFLRNVVQEMHAVLRKVED
jgi:SAM-dependent methyltransferase